MGHFKKKPAVPFYRADRMQKSPPIGRGRSARKANATFFAAITGASPYLTWVKIEIGTEFFAKTMDLFYREAGVAAFFEVAFKPADTCKLSVSSEARDSPDHND